MRCLAAVHRPDAGAVMGRGRGKALEARSIVLGLSMRVKLHFYGIIFQKSSVLFCKGETLSCYSKYEYLSNFKYIQDWGPFCNAVAAVIA